MPNYKSSKTWRDELNSAYQKKEKIRAQLITLGHAKSKLYDKTMQAKTDLAKLKCRDELKKLIEKERKLNSKHITYLKKEKFATTKFYAAIKREKAKAK